MKKLSFRQPKYIIPLIMLPFFMLFFFVFNSWGSSKVDKLAKKDSIPADYINPTMPGVSNEVSDGGIKDKFGAYLDAYKHNKDASALYNIDNNGTVNTSDFNSAYSSDDLKKLQAQRRLDSMTRYLATKHAAINNRVARLHGPNNYNTAGNNTPINENDLLRGFSYNADRQNETHEDKAHNSYNDQMKLFRDQMSVMDSLQKTYTSQATDNNPGVTNTESGKRRKTLTNNFNAKEFDPTNDSTFKPLSVRRNRGTHSGFNTISASKPETTIKAIIDENLKASAGSKVRIRLLNDIFVGDYLVPQGTYLYGVVTGFQTQRINISINQVMYENKPLPVQLDVFDNDGYLGLYVPNSNFREFTKELGTQGTQGLSQVRTSDNSNVTTGLISQLFQTASTSVSKLIRQEKAILKYNYIVFLKERSN